MSDAAYQVRSVHQLLEIHDDGDTLAKINEAFQKGLDDMADRQQSGEKAVATLVLTIKMEASPKDVQVTLAHELKLPKRDPAKVSFFVTDDNRLTTRNPRQREAFGGKEMGPRGSTLAG